MAVAQSKDSGAPSRGWQRREGFGSEPVSEVEIRQLEGILDRLADADDWMHGLHIFWKALHPDQQAAFNRLVRLGCIPHDLARHVEEQINPRGTQVEQRARKETLIYLPRLRKLTIAFESLSLLCERYIALRENYGGSKFHLDRNIVAFLRHEAAAIREFVSDSDQRRHGRRTWAETQLWFMMRDVKMTTGEFQDRLIAKLLGSSPGAMNAEALKRWRARENIRWTGWKPPAYLIRPASRIKLE